MRELAHRRKLAIDLDSVLADTMIVWAEEYNKRKNSSITKDNIVSWDISKTLDISIIEVRTFSHISGTRSGKIYHQQNRQLVI